jgi:hypothetical protein
MSVFNSIEEAIYLYYTYGTCFALELSLWLK